MHTLDMQRTQVRPISHGTVLHDTTPAKHLEPMTTHMLSLCSRNTTHKFSLEDTTISHASLCQESALNGPQVNGGNQKGLPSTVKDQCHQGETSALKPGSQVEDTHIMK